MSTESRRLAGILFFFSVLDADATKPNGLINLAYVGAVLLAIGVLTPGVGLIRKPTP
jgi:hypothetical protein